MKILLIPDYLCEEDKQKANKAKLDIENKESAQLDKRFLKFLGKARKFADSVQPNATIDCDMEKRQLTITVRVTRPNKSH